jgi:hypothetical protein
MLKILYSLLLLSIVSLSQGNAQELKVSAVEIEKAMHADENDRVRIEMYLPVSTEKFDFVNPIDYSQTELISVKDDAGKNLLSYHQEKIELLKEKGFLNNEQVINFIGVGNYSENRDLKFETIIYAAPTRGAKEITLKGEITLNFISNDEKELALKGIPVGQSDDNGGIQTEIGNISIRPSITLTMEDVEYYIFDLITDVSIIGIDQAGDKTRSEVQRLGMGLEANQLVFREVPEMTDFNVLYSIPEKRTIPFELKISVGL